MTGPASSAPTRSAGFAQLGQFLPSAGSRYARTRNFDFGPARRGNTSVLSPYIRHRLVLEEEVVAAVLEKHTFSAASKFIDEVFWRAYFKGFLEQRPSIWADYRESVAEQLQSLEADPRLLDRYTTATGGNSGIDCFDAWIDELTETGYLHNHARMWFASIWVFTLRLPWQLGADFFLRHLIDGDPASNTLSWRWVSGLHTRGKTYLARVSNIANFTDQRFNPQGKLATSATPVSESRVHPLEPLPAAAALPDDENFGLLVTEDDCAPEVGLLGRPPVAVLGLSATRRRSPLPVGVPAFEFARGAVTDAVSRVRSHYEVPGTVIETDDTAGRIIEWASAHRVDTLVTAQAPVGPVRDLLRGGVTEALSRQGIRLLTLRRDYDSASWPHATHGFFRLRKSIPAILAELGILNETRSRAG